MNKAHSSHGNISTGCSGEAVGCLVLLLILIGMATTFFVPFVGLGMIIFGIIINLIYRLTPTGIAEARQAAQRAAIEAQKAAEKAAIKANIPKEIDRMFYSLTNDPGNAELLEQILSLLNKLDQPLLNEKMATVGLELLKMYAVYPEVRQRIFKLADKSQSFISNLHFTVADFYRATLSILEEYPTAPGIRQFALNVGRSRYSRFNGGRITIAQEQSIQSDILVRIR